MGSRAKTCARELASVASMGPSGLIMVTLGGQSRTKEYFEQNEYYDYEYDDGEYHDDDNDHNEEDDSLFIQ